MSDAKMKLRVTLFSAIVTFAFAGACLMPTARATTCDPTVDCNDNNPCTTDACDTTGAPPSVTFFCADDAHQDPVLVTTQDANQLIANDGQWTEFLYPPSRPYAGVFAAAGEVNFGLPMMRCFSDGIQNGTYDVYAKLYTNDPGRNMRYYYQFSLASPVQSVDTVGGSGGTEQFTEYLLGQVTVSNGTVSVYFQDALLTGSGYPFFGWGSIRLQGVGTATGGCTHTPTPGVACNDGNACTTGDVCDAAGVCGGGSTVSCDDGNPCTLDVCNPASGCAHTIASGASCDDGNQCTTQDRCDAGGNCVGGPPKSCDDGNPCTSDACDPATGCGHAPSQCEVVTSSELCQFDRDKDLDGDQFGLTFSPDPAKPTTWRLGASNPGQFFDNVFYLGAGSTSLTLTVPYPFVTQGAVPVHVYDSASTNVSDGGICISPGNEVANSDAAISLGSYTDTNGDGKVGMGDTVALTVQLPALQNGFAYVGVHLDYGLKKVGNFKKNPTNDAVDAATNVIIVPDEQVYPFSNSAFGDVAQVMSENRFKKSPGVAGLVSRINIGDPVAGTPVQIFNGSGKLLGTVTTDEDGWYMYPYKYTGKAATFTVKVPAYGLSQNTTLKSNSFVVVNFLTP